jgi:small subunit ribosomal protein S17
MTMADDPEQQAEPETPDADAAAQVPADGPAQPAQQADDAAGEGESGDAPTAEAEAEAPAAEAPDAGEPREETPPAAAAPAPAPREPEEQLAPKERRRRTRSRHAGEARPQRSPEQRHSERLAERAKKAQRRRARRQQERAKRAPATSGAPIVPAPAGRQGTRKVRQGIVVSNKANKTIVVRIDVARRHRRYEKIVRSSNTLHAHDESNDAREGDTVRVIESRPLSRTKHWRLVEVLERAQ